MRGATGTMSTGKISLHRLQLGGRRWHLVVDWISVRMAPANQDLAPILDQR